ncbi:ubiquitin-like Rad60 SUMO-like protein [Medicago truncatula]|uniref:Ubiquitin-like Rad60 SUMO-like protein n=1 Tax=Medicago truncatula TaxID=3880 RepID=A0A072TJF0_MEDTR|nr:ubiquitin-like Rad60 SUMO-like protein [Medicago truncatula]
MMNLYCDRTSVDFNSVVFLFDGRKIRDEQTPDEVAFHMGKVNLFHHGKVGFND